MPSARPHWSASRSRKPHVAKTQRGGATSTSNCVASSAPKRKLSTGSLGQTTWTLEMIARDRPCVRKMPSAENWSLR